MSIIFSFALYFALYPAFFVILYAIGSLFFPTSNGATVFAALSAVIVCTTYYYIRRSLGYSVKSKQAKSEKESILISRLMLLAPEKFESLFPPQSLCDNSFLGINEEKVILHLRKYGTDKKIVIYSLKGITSGASDLLKLLNIEYKLYSGSELFSAAENADLPEIKIWGKITRTDRFLRAVTSKPFLKFSVKYGAALIFLSLITPYKTYYSAVGFCLAAYGIFMFFYRKRKKV